MVIDCDRCEVRGLACGDCVIGVLLGPPRMPAASDDAEAATILHLPPGAYTAVTVGADGGTGVSLVEVYNLD